MYKGIKKKLCLVFFAAFLTILVGCANQNDNTVNKEEKATKKEVKLESKEESTSQDGLIYGINAAPDGVFNPLIFNTQYDGNVVSLVYGSLLQLNPKLEIEPSMAEKYEMSEDGKKVTFILRDGLKFHDGEPLTSEDVKFTLESIANPDYEGDLGSYVESISGYEEFNDGNSDNLTGIVVDDEKTIEINFDEPYSPVLTNLGTLGIIPKHIWEDIDIKDWNNSHEQLENPIGSGPYKFDKYQQGEYVSLVSNTDYFDGEPKINKFTFKVVNEDTVTAELINKSVDIADISALKSDDESKLADASIKVDRYPNSKIQYMGFNLRKDILQDINLRKAMIYAINRQAIVDGLLEGNGEVINTPMIPDLWSYPEEGLTDYGYNPEKAKELLKEAGYEDSDGNGFVDKDGKDLELTLDVPTGDQIREQTATIIQNDCKEVGIKINLDPREFPALMDKVVGNHDFELYLMGNTLSADPDPTPNWRSTQASDEEGVYGWNISSFKDYKADELMDLNRKQTNLEDRAETLKEFGKILNEELPWIPLYVGDIIRAYNSDLQNYNPNTFVDFYDVQNWELSK